MTFRHSILISAALLAACQKGVPVSFVAAASLVHGLMEARDKKRLLRLQRQLAKIKLLIMLAFGLFTCFGLFAASAWHGV